MFIKSQILALCEEFRTQRLSPLEAARAHLKAIEERGAAANAFCFVDPATTLSLALASEARHRRGDPLGPLDGVPISIKDTINVAGWPTRFGSRTSSESPAVADAISIRRLRDAGAVFIGKTTTPEFAWKGMTDSPLTGITRNPLDLTRTSGGSSGGAAAAIRLGLGAAAVGSDAAGSVRIPAAFCGVVGFKPTFGQIPLDPYPVAFSQMAHIGVLTESVADARICATIMSGCHASDWTARVPANLNAPVDLRSSGGPVARIGIPTEDSLDQLAPEVAFAWSDFLQRALSGWRDPVPLDLPFAHGREVASMLYRIGCLDQVVRVPEPFRAHLDPELLEFVEPVRRLAAADLISNLSLRERLAGGVVNTLRSRVDVVITPTVGVLPPTIKDLERPGRARDWLDWNLFTPLFNLAHCPAISVPWSLSGQPPIGIQIAAAPGNDARVLAVAAEIERLSSDPG